MKIFDSPVYVFPKASNFLLAMLLIVLLASPLAHWLESSLVSHLVVEFPLLIFIGMVVGLNLDSSVAIERFSRSINRGGIFGILLASFLLAFWMIPRWLDASLTSTTIGYLKYASLMISGFCLGVSWSKVHVLVRAVIKIEFLTMLFRLGWLYLISPVRLCNNYLLGEQVWLGRVFLMLAVTLAVYWLVPVFFGSLRKETKLDALLAHCGK